VKLNCNGDSAYADGFPILATDLNVVTLRTLAASDSMYFGRYKISRDVFQVLKHRAALVVGWWAWRDLSENNVCSHPSRFSAGGGGGGEAGLKPLFNGWSDYFKHGGFFFPPLLCGGGGGGGGGDAGITTPFNWLSDILQHRGYISP